MSMRVELIGLAAVLLLASCQEQKTVILEQQSSAALAANAAPPPPPPPRPRMVAQQDTSPCRAPAGTGPFERLPHPVSSAPVPMPPRALAEHVNGCAGVRFRLSPDGSPTDMTVMAEYPAGYGFGDNRKCCHLGHKMAGKRRPGMAVHRDQHAPGSAENLAASLG